MTTLPRRGIALASCLMMSFWSIALVGGTSAQAAAPTSDILAASDTVAMTGPLSSVQIG
jgi:hypothetical protein